MVRCHRKPKGTPRVIEHNRLPTIACFRNPGTASEISNLQTKFASNVSWIWRANGTSLLAGQTVSPRRHLGRNRSQFCALLGKRNQGRSCVCTTAAAGARASAFNCPSRPHSCGTATFPACSLASSTAIASTAPGSRRAVCASIPPSCSIDPYAKAITGSIDWEQAHLSLSLRRRECRPQHRPPRQRLRHAQEQLS